MPRYLDDTYGIVPDAVSDVDPEVMHAGDQYAGTLSKLFRMVPEAVGELKSLRKADRALGRGVAYDNKFRQLEAVEPHINTKALEDLDFFEGLTQLELDVGNDRKKWLRTPEAAEARYNFSKALEEGKQKSVPDLQNAVGYPGKQLGSKPLPLVDRYDLPGMLHSMQALPPSVGDKQFLKVVEQLRQTVAPEDLVRLSLDPSQPRIVRDAAVQLLGE